jgi:hypothetical protein
VACHDRRLWVGEFVLDGKVKPKHPHHLKDRTGADKHAWVAGYRLDANDDPVRVKGRKGVAPDAVLCVRQKVQGLAFLGGHVILSVSHGRRNDSTLAVYRDPLRKGNSKPHAVVKVCGGRAAPLWFLDGKNRVK